MVDLREENRSEFQKKMGLVILIELDMGIGLLMEWKNSS